MSSSSVTSPCIVTVTLNPAVELVLEAPGFAAEPRPAEAARTIARLPGGKGVNVSRSLAALGVRSVAAGPLGAGERDFFESAFLRECGGLVQSAFTPVASRTRHAVTIIDPRSGADFHVREAGTALSPEELAGLERDIAARAKPGVVMAVSGSAPPQTPPDAVRKIVDSAAARGALVALDAAGAALRACMDAPLWLLKVNAAELSGALGVALDGPEQTARAARSLTRSGGGAFRAVAVTLGAEGAVLASPAGYVWAARTGARRPVVSTVGCGDAFLAGLLAAICGDGDGPAGASETRWRDALAAGVCVGSASACSPVPAGVDRAALAEALESVEVRALGAESGHAHQGWGGERSREA